MDLRWWLVAIAGCVALAVGIAAAALWPTDGRRELRPLASTARLTRLPEYRRAVRMRSIWLTVSTLLLVAGVIAAVLAPPGHRSAVGGQRAPRAHAGPGHHGLYGCPGHRSRGGRGPREYFAEHAPTLAAERIGLTSANRRVIPLTRDYQYAAAQFAGRGAAARWQAADRRRLLCRLCRRPGGRARDVPDPGFPHFDAAGRGRPGRSSTWDRAICAPPRTHGRNCGSAPTGCANSPPGFDSGETHSSRGTTAVPSTQLVRATGGRSHPADGDAAAHLADILAHPPPASGASGDVATRTLESPDIPLVLALLAAAGLLVWRVVRR